MRFIALFEEYFVIYESKSLSMTQKKKNSVISEFFGLAYTSDLLIPNDLQIISKH